MNFDCDNCKLFSYCEYRSNCTPAKYGDALGRSELKKIKDYQKEPEQKYKVGQKFDWTMFENGGIFELVCENGNYVIYDCLLDRYINNFNRFALYTSSMPRYFSLENKDAMIDSIKEVDPKKNLEPIQQPIFKQQSYCKYCKKPILSVCDKSYCSIAQLNESKVLNNNSKESLKNDLEYKEFINSLFEKTCDLFNCIPSNLAINPNESRNQKTDILSELKQLGFNYESYKHENFINPKI